MEEKIINLIMSGLRLKIINKTRRELCWEGVIKLKLIIKQINENYIIKY